jgi:hypothetical protein
VLIIGHVATRWGLDHLIGGMRRLTEEPGRPGAERVEVARI